MALLKSGFFCVPVVVASLWTSAQSARDAPPFQRACVAFKRLSLELHRPLQSAGTLPTSSTSQSGQDARAPKKAQISTTALVVPGDNDALPTLDVKRDFGARGDGHSDDSRAFARLAEDVNRRDGGVRIVIPEGVYIVGGQTPNGRDADGSVYRFDGRDGLILQSCTKPVVIEGENATLRLPDGLRFGTFDAQGATLNVPLPFYDTRAAATTGYLVGAVACADVRIRGLELDGRNTTYKLGGGWGDKDRQCRSYGFYFDRCQNVQLSGVSAHHFGLDGLYIKRGGLREDDPAWPHVLRNCRFEWNGRQGLSWSGGIGLRASGCTFAHTGYAINKDSGEPLVNAPGAGVDIEAEKSICRDGQFADCLFFHTRGPALYCETGDNADVSFQRCRFWNFDNYSIVPHNPRLSFFDCDILGAAISAYSSAQTPSDGTRFSRCTFEDRAHPQWKRAFSDAYAALFAFDDLQGGVRFDDCHFLAHHVKGPFIRQPRAGETDGFSISGGSMRLEHFNGAGEAIATLQGGRIENFAVDFALPPDAPPGLHVWTNNQTPAGAGVQVSGRGARWRAPDGEVGAIRRDF